MKTREISWAEFERQSPAFGPCNSCNRIGPFALRKLVPMDRRESGPPPSWLKVGKHDKALKPAGGLCLRCALDATTSAKSGYRT